MQDKEMHTKTTNDVNSSVWALDDQDQYSILVLV